MFKLSKISQSHRITNIAMVLTMLFISIVTVSCNPKDAYIMRGESQTSYCISTTGNFMLYTTVAGKLHVVYKIDLNTHISKMLFTTPTYINDMSLDANNNILLFSGSISSDGPYHIFSYNLLSTHLLQLSHGSSCDLYPSYDSQNGSIIFTRSFNKRSYSMGGIVWYDWYIMSMNPHSKTINKLYPHAFENISRPTYVSQSNNVFFCPDTINRSIDILDIKSGTLKTILKDGSPWDPVISPDGKKIYFISDKTHAFDYEVWSMNPDGHNLSELTHLHSYIQNLQVSHDGKYLYFRSDPTRTLTYDLMKLDLNTGKVRKIFNSSVFAGK